MKYFLTLLTAFALTGCKPEPSSETEAPPQPTEEELKEARLRTAALLNEKMNLEKELDKLIAKHKTDPDNKMKVVQEESQQAQLELRKIEQSHPSLQKLNQEIMILQSHKTQARRNKDQKMLNNANNSITELNSQLENLKKELPAIREARDQITRSQKQLKVLRRELVASTPEGQKIVARIQEIENTLNKK